MQVAQFGSRRRQREAARTAPVGTVRRVLAAVGVVLGIAAAHAVMAADRAAGGPADIAGGIPSEAPGEGTADGVPALRPSGAALKVKPPFPFDKKTRKSASGIACPRDGDERRCLAVFDEGHSAQFVVIGRKQLKPSGPVIDLTGTGGELDAEAATAADGFFFVAGSHSVKRDSCKPNPASRALVRFRTGADGAPQERIVSNRLWDLMKDEPLLRAHLEGCLGQGSGGSSAQMHARPGVNIEGMAAVGGRLYFGFRGPAEDGTTLVFSADAAALFDGGDAAPRLDRLALGAHVGIRDMTPTTGDAILLLLGPDDVEGGDPPPWRVAEWRPTGAAATDRPAGTAETDPTAETAEAAQTAGATRAAEAATEARVLARLEVRRQDVGKACFEALKPEAIAVLDESDRGYRVLVLSDGVCDGGPLIFEIPK